MARSVAASNVTINFLLPGTFDTERLRSNIASNAKNKGVSFDEAKADRIASVPARRFGQPDEFGAACAFLCSAQAGYLTGQSPANEQGRLAPAPSHPPEIQSVGQDQRNSLAVVSPPEPVSLAARRTSQVHECILSLIPSDCKR